MGRGASPEKTTGLAATASGRGGKRKPGRRKRRPESAIVVLGDDDTEAKFMMESNEEANVEDVGVREKASVKIKISGGNQLQVRTTAAT